MTTLRTGEPDASLALLAEYHAIAVMVDEATKWREVRLTHLEEMIRRGREGDENARREARSLSSLVHDFSDVVGSLRRLRKQSEKLLRARRTKP